MSVFPTSASAPQSQSVGVIVVSLFVELMSFEHDRELELLWIALAEERQVVSMKSSLVVSLQSTLDTRESKIAALQTQCDELTAEVAHLQHAARQRDSAMGLHAARAAALSASDSGSMSAPESESDDIAHTSAQETPGHTHPSNTAMLQLRRDFDRLQAHHNGLSENWRRAKVRDVVNLERLETFARSQHEQSEEIARRLLFAAMTSTFPRPLPPPAQPLKISPCANCSVMAHVLAQVTIGAHASLDAACNLAFEKQGLWLAQSQFTAQSRVSAASASLAGAVESVATVLDGSYSLLLSSHWRVADEMLRSAKLVHVNHRRDTLTNAFAQYRDTSANLMSAFVAQAANLLVQCLPAYTKPRPVVTPTNDASQTRLLEMGHRIRALEERTAEKTRVISSQARRISELELRCESLQGSRRQGGTMGATEPTPFPAALSPSSLPRAADESMNDCVASKALIYECVLEAHGLGLAAMRQRLTSLGRAEPLSRVVKEALLAPQFLVQSEGPVVNANEVASHAVSQIRQATGTAAQLLLHVHDEYGSLLSDRLSELAGWFAMSSVPSKTNDSVRADIAERSLSLVEAQRDQSMTVANWIHTEATSAIRSLNGLVSRVNERLAKPESTTARLEVSAASEMQAQQQARDLEKASQQSVAQFSTICDAFLDHAARVHTRLVDSEHQIAVYRRSAADFDCQGAEFKQAASKYALTHRIEREMSDAALALLHDQMTAERNAALRSFKAMGVGLSRRNLAIQWLHQHICESQTDAKQAVLLGQYIWHAFASSMEGMYASMRRELVNQRLRQLPSVAEVRHVFLVVHAELGISLEEAAVSLFASARQMLDLFAEVNTLSIRHRAEMLEASTEIVALSRKSRLEQSAFDSLREHAVSCALGMVFEQRDAVREIFAHIMGALGSALQQRQHAVADADAARAHREEALSSLATAARQAETELHRADCAEATSMALRESLQKVSSDLAHDRDELNVQNERIVALENVKNEAEQARDRLSALVQAEQRAHELARSHEAALERDLAAAVVRSERAEGKLVQLETDLSREKEAHRSTIRSMSA
jgi:hypothetical protein